MNIFFAGVGGVGIGPLAHIAIDAGYDVQGSDRSESNMVQGLRDRGISISTDGDDGSFLRACHEAKPIDWFVYTSALPDTHPELVLARQLGIKTAKRDELLAYIIAEKNLKLIAVAGTHGKTTTTGMLVWIFQQLGIPLSYSVGTTLRFGPSGKFDPQSEYFVYECDEFDRNFLHFHPYLSLILSIDYDHPDIYPTPKDYTDAFDQFIHQSDMTIMWQKDTEGIQPPQNSWVLQDNEVLDLKLPGAHNRQNGTLAVKAMEFLTISSREEVTEIVQRFPGTDRRFERLGDNLYTDYGHHPAEITAMLQLAREVSDHVTLVYQPHQNVRQHEIRNDYRHCFAGADEVYWLPTYLSREDPNLPILSPEALTKEIDNTEIIISDLNDELWNAIQRARHAGNLVLVMGAGNIDGWVRDRLRV